MIRPAWRLRSSEGSGFTLLELLIVMALISLLASLLVPNFIRARDQANLSACSQNLRSLWTAKCMVEAETKRAGILEDPPTTNTGYGSYLVQGSPAYKKLSRYCEVSKMHCPLGGKRKGAYMYWELHEASFEKIHPGSVVYTSSFSCMNSELHPGCAQAVQLGGFPRYTARGLSLVP
jgi:prepilin-type N-terminal cleavage/methylation domain-containing protein